MIIHAHVPLFMRKRSSVKNPAEVEKDFSDVPKEIVFKKSVPSKRRPSRHEKLRQLGFDLGLISPLLETEDSKDQPAERASMDSTSSVAKDLWRSATAADGPIAAIDQMCKYGSVVSIMSRDEETRKKVLDDFLNHGEF